MTSSLATVPAELPASALPALLQLLPNGVVYYTPAYDLAGTVVDFQVAYLNPNAQQLLKLPAQLPTSYLQHWPGSLASGMFAAHCGVFLSAQSTPLGVDYHPEGDHRRLRVQACWLEAGLLVSFAEATDAPGLAAEAARRQRQVFHDVFAQTPALIALLRQPGHHFDYVNQAYQQLFPGRQLVGRPLAEAVPEMLAQGYVDMLDRVYQTGETFFGEERPFVLPPVGTQPPRTRFFHFTYQAYREAGAIVGVSIFALDATEQVVARQQREAQQQQLHDFFERAPVAIAILRGPRYVIELANPAVCALWGRPRAQAVGTPLFELLPEVAGQGFEELLDGVLATGVPYVAHEMSSTIDRHGQRDTVYWNFVYDPLPDSRGIITGVTIVATEVTDQVQARHQVDALNHALRAANDELHAANTQLTRTNVDLDNFIYTASHDLKVPIGNIEGLLYALRAELPAEVLQTGYVGPILTRMLDAVDRFTRTIGHLTEVAKLQNEHSPPAAALNLAAVVEDVRLDLASLLETAQARLRVDLPAAPPVLFAQKNLRSVVYNLLSNALKYRHPDRQPHIDVRAQVQPGFTVLAVHDNGLGIAPAQLPKLFTMFQRFHTHVEGTGLGLYMVKRLVDNAGGTIEVESQLGVGTTFFVRLPHAPTA
jgi:PAS domain S-box-containing protein